MTRMLVAFLAACLFATGAFGATLKVIQGEALVRRDSGYKAVKGVSDLAPGDTVLAKAGSSAEVTFSDGCTVYLGMGMIFDVPSDPPCGKASSTSGSPFDSPSDSGAVGTQDWSAATQTAVASGASQVNLMPYLLGATAIGGAAAGAIALSGGGGGGRPASP